tara:strand:+ start:118 stop:447 length:330 start_codon:yes stop_codon:yes gene_type:complete
MKKFASKQGSQLILKDDGSYTFKISKQDWERIGKEAYFDMQDDFGNMSPSGPPYWWEEGKTERPCGCHGDKPKYSDFEEVESKTGYSDSFFALYRCAKCGHEFQLYLEG